MAPLEVKRIKTFADFHRRKARIKVLVGGAGSGKTTSTAQFMLSTFLKGGKPKKFIVARKTLPSLRRTAYRVLKNMASEWGISVGQDGTIKENKAELTWTYGKNLMDFMSIDDPEKIKSMEADYIWIEEATDLDIEDVSQLRIRLNRTDDNAQLIMTFNPVDAHHPLITDFVDKPGKDVAVHHSTYKDNPFLSDSFKAELESFKEKDSNFYNIYALGIPGQLQHVIYQNYSIDDIATWHDHLQRNMNPDVMGLDFGFNNPSALTLHWMRDGEIYSKCLLYESKLTNSDLIRKLESLKVSKTAPLYCDAAEPARIDELKRAGFNAKPADKSVKDGIDFLKSKRWHIDASSDEMVKEIRNYKYIEKNGLVIDEPVKAFDHALDSSRYAVYTHYKDLVTGPDSSRFLVLHSGRYH